MRCDYCCFSTVWVKWIQIDIENILVVLFLIFALIDYLKLQFNTLGLVKIH